MILELHLDYGKPIKSLAEEHSMTVIVTGTGIPKLIGKNKVLHTKNSEKLLTL